MTGTGVAPNAIRSVIGVTKAYCTRVGEGPFPSEIKDEVADTLRARGNEYGAVTGRPRRCGWVDLPLLRYATSINGIDWMVVTKLDVLDTLDEIPVCVGYKVGGKKTDKQIPASAGRFESVQCIYENVPGWKKSTLGITEFKKLPQKAQTYMKYLEEKTGARIGMVSTGPDRDQTIFIDEFADAIQSGKKKQPAKRA